MMSRIRQLTLVWTKKKISISWCRGSEPLRCVFLVCPDACPCLPYPYHHAAVASPPPPHVSNEHFRPDCMSE